MNDRPPHVVIVGGGFGGLYAARALRRQRVRVTIIDRRNYHLFQPLLYQVATATLSPADIARPIRNILRNQRNTEVLLGDVADVDRSGKTVRLGSGRIISFDYLILAAGAVDQYFGHPEWSSRAPGLKSIDDATEIRRRFLLAFEAAEWESDPARRAALLTFVVIGGGPTGVEMAGAFVEIARHTLRRDFRRIDPATARILLIEGGPRLLGAYPDDLSAKAKEQLERLGAKVRLNSIVSRIEADAVYVGEERIPAYNVVWAAGVAASPLGRSLEARTDRMGRVQVEPDLTIAGSPEIFVIGDMASFIHQTGDPLPGTAPVAMQQADAAARSIMRLLNGERPEPFRYRDRGSMATIGRAAAVAQIGRWKLSGLIAWLAWLFIHIVSLIGFRSRVAVLLEWAWSYVTWQRDARLITGDVRPELVPAPAQELEAVQADELDATIVAPPEGGGSGWMEGDTEQAENRT